MNIAYLCNSFPEPSEWYVAEEIHELQRRSATVIACSVLRRATSKASPAPPDTLYLLPLTMSCCLAAAWLLIRRFTSICDLTLRVLRGREASARRIRTLAHTFLGAYCAARLKHFSPDHIHVHHGYFAAWVGMVAARLLNIGFSMTLHGSDLLVRADYLDTKLQNCSFCFTVSEFNRRYILERYPNLDSSNVLVQHLGVDPEFWKRQPQKQPNNVFRILSVGRLHPVKNHAFLLQACRMLRLAGVDCRCTIAGEGDERLRLERLRVKLDLENEVTLTGQISRSELRDLYAEASVVVLASLSEGIPLTLMEAMAMGCVVLAPAITGIPELVVDGRTGFLYQPLSMDDFLIKLQLIHDGGHLLHQIRRAARQHIDRNFNNRKNLRLFANTFLSRLKGSPTGNCSVEERTHEDPILQQIQFSVQRH